MIKDLALLAWILVALTLTSLLASLALAGRRLVIRRPGGAVDCRMRLDGDPRWHRGVIAYRTGELMCFRSLRPGLRPDAVFDRQSLRLAQRRRLDQDTAVAAFETGNPGETLWLQLSSDALTGLLAWVEAAPQRWFGEGALDRP